MRLCRDQRHAAAHEGRRRADAELALLRNANTERTDRRLCGTGLSYDADADRSHRASVLANTDAPPRTGVCGSPLRWKRRATNK